MGLKAGHTVGNEVGQVFHSHDVSDVLRERLRLAHNIVWYVTVQAPEKTQQYKFDTCFSCVAKIIVPT